jgi:hypothetical protein
LAFSLSLFSLLFEFGVMDVCVIDVRKTIMAERLMIRERGRRRR